MNRNTMAKLEAAGAGFAPARVGMCKEDGTCVLRHNLIAAWGDVRTLFSAFGFRCYFANFLTVVDQAVLLELVLERTAADAKQFGRILAIGGHVRLRLPGSLAIR